jgi:hypothetical protein
MKRKQNEKEVNRSETNNFWKRNKAKYTLLISLWSDAKNSKRKEAKFFFFRVSVRNGSHFASFRFEAKKNVCEPAHPNWNASGENTNQAKKNWNVFGTVYLRTSKAHSKLNGEF